MVPLLFRTLLRAKFYTSVSCIYTIAENKVEGNLKKQVTRITAQIFPLFCWFAAFCQFANYLRFSQETLEAMEDARTGKNLIGPFDTVDDMFAALEED